MKMINFVPCTKLLHMVKCRCLGEKYPTPRDGEVSGQLTCIDSRTSASFPVSGVVFDSAPLLYKSDRFTECRSTLHEVTHVRRPIGQGSDISPAEYQ